MTMTCFPHSIQYVNLLLTLPETVLVFQNFIKHVTVSNKNLF